MVQILILLLLIVFFIAIRLLGRRKFEDERQQRRKDYRDVYLKSDAWKRKRYVVMKRDNWRCVHCGARATQVHHKRYLRKIGKEPIEWLVSLCKPCHEAQHGINQHHQQ